MEFRSDLQASYRILQSKDRRFDGRIFFGVRSTGIYCRPICPAATPNIGNVSFYSTAAAAAQAGFRPCLRCHPEAAPGSTSWQGPSAIAHAAKRLIDEGYANDHSLAQLAARFAVSDRHLRRLFMQTFGASPVAMVQTQRLQLAKQLLDETRLPLADIAFAAGYSSLRRFNSSIRAAWGSAPSVLRRLGAREAAGEALTLHLSYRPPYDWPQTLAFLRTRQLPGVERFAADRYQRSVTLTLASGAAVSGTVSVSHAPAKHALRIVASPALLPAIGAVISRLRRLFDLDANPQAINAALAADTPIASPIASAVASAPGTRLPGAWDGFEVLVRAVLGQQVSVAAALTLVTRLVNRFGQPLADGWRLFPTPEAIAAGNLSGLGITGRRIDALQTVARMLQAGALDLHNAADLDSYTAQLTALPGIGDWTAHYVAMRALNHPNAFPAGDLILRRAATLTAPPKPMGQLTPTQLRQLAEPWQPWRAYAVIHLWRRYNEFTLEQKTSCR